VVKSPLEKTNLYPEIIMKIFAVILTLFLFSLSVSAQTKPMSKSDAKTAAAIRKVMEDQAAAWNRGDVEGFMQGYWKSEEMIFVSGTDVSRGWQDALDRYKKNYGSKEKMGALTFSGLEITVLSKDSAVVLGSWALQRAADNPGGKFTLIFRKFKDGWKIVHDHTS
jgi:ketosteroid isomerase-like protein